MVQDNQYSAKQRPPFIGRETYLSKLNALWKRKRAALVVCVGRRRIGKSRLIQEFGYSHADHFLEFQGLSPRSKQTNIDQLKHFGEKLAGYMRLAEPIILNNWTQAFALLAQSIPQTGKTVILLDEISWMGQHDRDFAGKIKDTWDTRFSTYPNIVLVLCGSVSAWIEHNILQNTGFLDRPSLRINLPELPLHDCNRMVWSKKTQISNSEKLRMLAVTGGVPRYLEELDPTQSSVDNIQRLCFDPSGALFRNRDGLSEFELIFNDVFQARAITYRLIVEALISGRKTLSEISNETGKSRSGILSTYAKDLELAGYLREEPHFSVGHGEKKGSHFRLRDNYLRFYLKYIEPHRKAIDQGRFNLSNLANLPAWDSIMGLQFENLVLNNQQLIEKELGIEGQVLQGGPYYQTNTQRYKGCQIDLLLETEYSLYICEIKLRKKIDGNVIEQVLEKRNRLLVPKSKKHLNVFPVLIYTGNIASVVGNSDFFQKKIDFSKMLTF